MYSFQGILYALACHKCTKTPQNPAYISMQLNDSNIHNYNIVMICRDTDTQDRGSPNIMQIHSVFNAGELLQ